MANWCENVARISAPSEDEARALFEALKAGHDYEGVENVVCSERGAEADGGDADHAYWGGEHRAVPGKMRVRGAVLDLNWGSRWSPPIAFYEQLEAQGFAVNAMYLEPGEAFCGTYADGQQTNVEYRVRADVPAAIEAEWGADLFDWIFEDEEGEENRGVTPLAL